MRIDQLNIQVVSDSRPFCFTYVDASPAKHHHNFTIKSSATSPSCCFQTITAQGKKRHLSGLPSTHLHLSLSQPSKNSSSPLPSSMRLIHVPALNQACRIRDANWTTNLICLSVKRSEYRLDSTCMENINTRIVRPM